MNGYAGFVLRIDLNSKAYRKEPLDTKLAKEYIGGRGFVDKVVFDEVPVGADPLGPLNKVAIAPGPMSGIFMPASGKVQFGALSPATRMIGDSNMGGHFGPEIKYAGYDLVIIEGVSETPVTIVIDDDRVSFKDASGLWGKGSYETEEALKKQLGESFQISTIGPAGENKVFFACINHDFGRQAGRTGIGAVLGSKKVKAIAVRGSKSVPVADPDAVSRIGMDMFQKCFEKPGLAEWTPLGTSGVTPWVNEVGAFPTKNFQTTYFEGHEKIGGQAMRDKIIVTDKGCFTCPTPCGKYSRLTKDGKEVFVEGPEYETIAMVGGDCMLPEIEDVAYANRVCDDLGLDTISGGAVIAFALECFDKGIITKEQLGREVRWGDVGSFEFLANIIARRQGMGDLLADGSRAAAHKLGHDSIRFATQVKGLEWSGYDARWAPAMMISYMTADIGAHHNRSWAITYDVAKGRDILDGKARRAVELQRIRPAFDLIGCCRLQWVEIGFELENYEGMFEAAFGEKVTWKDIYEAADRVWNMNRVRAMLEIPGFGRDHDYPPKRFMEEPVPTGPAKGKFLDKASCDRLLDDYYEERGWDKAGHPTRKTLEALKLGNCITALEEKGLI
ncbi:MAG TPA: aldehyde ferredoxin oxidoreductase family protein [Bacillota bacterium]|nr:aldehyde ferredoxin oxidoreductase family protein [Bacillota bacterium]HOA15376.1 aldehyde ferredoxin oxidoreductase family protein [Bacillota bacterium]